jgi:hypothetical protein
VAILVLGDSGDPGVLCLATYVQADGTLGATPVRRTPAEWGTVHVTGSDILPGTTYDVYADCRQDGSGFLSNPLRATTWFFGDVNNDGAAQIDDITLVFDGSQGVFGEGTTPQSLDVAPCAPDGVIDGDDVFYVQSAFAGAPFPCLLPCEACTPIEPPRANEMMVAKNRFVAFVDGNAGRSTAIRVSFAQLPPPYDGLNGLAMWVGEPREICENAAQTTPPDDGCGPAPGLGSRTFTAARLQCQAYYTDWSVYGAVYVYGEGVIPDGSYELQAIDEICDTSVENNYSAPFERTTSRWGDIVKNCTTDPCGAPDGLVNMTTDVTSLLDKFRNLSGAPIKARCDLAGLPPTDGELNLTIEILDVTHCLTAFVGGQYSFETIDPNRCP